MQPMKTVFSLFLAFMILISGIVFSAADEETRMFTDSLGRNVTVSAPVSKVAVTGPLAQALVFALCPEKLVGIAVPWNKSAEQYLAPAYYALPVIGQLYGGRGTLDPETLLASGAEVVIDVGEESDSVREEMDTFSEQTGIPFVHITAGLGTMGEAFRMLGTLLDIPEEAEVLADYCESTYAKIVDIKDSVTKKKVLYLLGTNGLHVIARGSYHAEAIDLLCVNAAEVDFPSSKGTGNETDPEQIMLWDPEVILFAPGSVYASVGKLPEWQSVSAVANKKYYEVPSGPENWMGFPPGVQRLLGLLWLGKLLYPEAAAYDLEAEAALYYRLFYHCELTHEQYAALIACA